MAQAHTNATLTDNNFWINRWETNNLGWHDNQHARTELLNFFKNSATKFSGKVFVPLCGASRDMVWLADQGLQVVGIEICQLAIDKLFTEYYPRQDYQQNGNIFSAGNITIIKGDLYNCPELKILAPFDLIYDRASLVAINYEDREKYIDLILSLLSPQAVSNLCYFLQGADYQPGQHFDPPHIFTQESAEFYFGKKFKKIQHVVRIDEGINFPSQVHLHSDHWIMGGRL